MEDELPTSSCSRVQPAKLANGVPPITFGKANGVGKANGAPPALSSQASKRAKRPRGTGSGLEARLCGARPRQLRRLLRLRATDPAVGRLLTQHELYPRLRGDRAGKPRCVLQFFQSVPYKPARPSPARKLTLTKRELLAKRARDYLEQVRYTTGDIAAFVQLLQSGQLSRQLSAGVTQLFEDKHPELVKQFAEFVNSNRGNQVCNGFSQSSPRPEERDVVISRGRAFGLRRLDCVNHEMLLQFRSLAELSFEQSDFDEDMDAYQQNIAAQERSLISATLDEKDVFHASCMCPMHPSEIHIDSEDDMNESWIEEQDAKLLDLFEDVTDADKDFMRLWNAFRRNNPSLISDNRLCQGLSKFVEQHRDEIAGPLNSAYSMHLLTCWEMGLLLSSEIEKLSRAACTGPPAMHAKPSSK